MQTHFYKTFTRPIAKVTLLAVLTYQVVYWAWAKLEADEIRAETDGKLGIADSRRRRAPGRTGSP